ncbi:PREDICTED: far upstream element-binding protein 2-like isoform X2 [Acromyrmex echinatior]|uniref:far upstream element-binding protein 2-like isoform X2 n=1 Tax=Acromyrmex echinatior TaxID=103372 RepID=UPI0005810CDE|nr:PREDICTED: far upstream element-binding protein 2-like isoform X2 [Acromyrmex echinatior]
MKAFYVLLLLTLIGIVFAKSTVDRKKVPPHLKPPNSSHDGGNGGGNGPGNGAPGGGPPSSPGGEPPSSPGGGLPSSGGIPLIRMLLQLVCSVGRSLLASISLDGLCGP